MKQFLSLHTFYLLFIVPIVLTSSSYLFGMEKVADVADATELSAAEKRQIVADLVAQVDELEKQHKAYCKKEEEDCKKTEESQKPQQTTYTLYRLSDESKAQMFQERANKLDWTPLHVAVAAGKDDEVKELIRKGAALEAKDKEGSTALHLAASYGQSESLGFLIASGADKNARNAIQATPLHSAAFKGMSSVIKTLLAAGVDIEAQDRNGFTPIHYAASSRLFYAMDALVEAGAKIDAKTKKGQTPLHLAVAHPGAVRQLLGLVSTQAVDEDGFTPLHYAAWKGQTDSIDMLVQANAKLDVKCKAGDTPLHTAAWYGHLHAVNALLYSGAALLALNNDGHSPLQCAEEKKHKKVAEALRKACKKEIKFKKERQARQRAEQEAEILRAELLRLRDSKPIGQEIIKRDKMALLLAKMQAPKVAAVKNAAAALAREVNANLEVAREKIAKSGKDECSEENSESTVGRSRESGSSLDA